MKVSITAVLLHKEVERQLQLMCYRRGVRCLGATRENCAVKMSVLKSRL